MPESATSRTSVLSTVQRQLITRDVNYPAGLVITRPNDVTAYAVNDAWGAAADAVVQVTLAAPPAGYTLAQFRPVVTNSRAPADSALGLGFIIFAEAPAAQFPDNGPVSLTDADIARILLLISGTTLSFNSISTPDLGLNVTAGINGRRRGRIVFQAQLLGATGDVGELQSTVAWPQTFWMLPIANTAEVPVALETLTFDMIVNYTKPITL